MNTTLYYCHVLSLGEDPHRQRTVDEFTESAKRFATTYRQFLPGADHELVVMLWRGDPTTADLSMWTDMPVRFIHHNPPKDREWEWAVQTTLANEKCDFMVSACSRAYFHRPGWLKRMVDARMRFGDGFYGSMSSEAGCPLQTHPWPNPHLRGTMWGFDLQTIRMFPHKVVTMEDEYRLECGEWNLCRWFESMGRPCILVTFDGEYIKTDWNKPSNTFCKGDQSNLLNWDRHTDAYRFRVPLKP